MGEFFLSGILYNGDFFQPSLPFLSAHTQRVVKGQNLFLPCLVEWCSRTAAVGSLAKRSNIIYIYSAQVQLPLITRDKLIHFTSLTCTMNSFQCKVMQVHFNRDFMGEKCCRHWDSNPRPSEFPSSGIQHNNHPYWDWSLFLNLRSGFKSHQKGYWLVCYKHT